ncbi:uncharacterized protein LOC141853948 [Brevipalpus obovatus]|uniref:uncharacterized protein LOC141853948 n=1 Tax=Brevipalpus obovatus TaxID=246614 RepID=UPI003D9FA7A8
MAQTSLFPAYQIILITILVVNVVFWILLLCWKFFMLNTMGQSVNRCRRFFSSLISFPTRISNFSGFGVTSAVIRINSDPPPPYEQAIKFPPLSSVSGRVGHCNLGGPTNHNDDERFICQLDSPQIANGTTLVRTTQNINSIESATCHVAPSQSISYESINSFSLKRSMSFNDMKTYNKFQKYIDYV